METKEVVERKFPGSPAGGDVLYFPYKQFSGRFGPNFFTYRVVDHKVLGRLRMLHVHEALLFTGRIFLRVQSTVRG